MFIEGLFFQLFLSDSSLDTWSTEHERMVPSVWIIWLHQPFWTATHVKCGGKRRLFTEVWTWYQCLAWPMMGRLVFEPVNLHDLLAPANFASFAQEPSLAGWQQKSPICTNILHRKQGLCVHWDTHRQSERRMYWGRDAKSSEHPEHACAIFPPAVLIFLGLYMCTDFSSVLIFVLCTQRAYVALKVVACKINTA